MELRKSLTSNKQLPLYLSRCQHQVSMKWKSPQSLTPRNLALAWMLSQHRKDYDVSWYTIVGWHRQLHPIFQPSLLFTRELPDSTHYYAHIFRLKSTGILALQPSPALPVYYTVYSHVSHVCVVCWLLANTPGWISIPLGNQNSAFPSPNSNIPCSVQGVSINCHE